METPKSEIKIEQITPYLTHKLRRDVLYPEMKIFEMEMDEDADGIHFGAFYENKLVGVVSLFYKGESYQFRKLAVDTEYQHKGIGSAILNYITDYAQLNGGTTIWCNARLSAIGFYLKANFAQTGNLFSKNGIDYEILEKTIIPSLIHPIA
jgi:phosphoribosylformimino-5-aminoimidazole carboxamide ribotide isomerase